MLNFLEATPFNAFFNVESVSFSVPTSRSRKFQSMNYKDFAEYFNHSREAPDGLGASSLLRDQTSDRLQKNSSYMGSGDKLRIGSQGKDFIRRFSFLDYLDCFETLILLVIIAWLILPHWMLAIFFQTPLT